MRHARLTSLAASAVLLLAPTVGAAPGWSQRAVEMCPTVRDGSGGPVRDVRGGKVLTVASAPCPAPAPEVVVAPEPLMPLPAAGPISAADGDGAAEADGIRVTFDFDSARLRPESFPTLDEIAAVLRRHPGQRVALTGHADAIGPEAYNQGLSERRARAVAAYLERAGVTPERLAVTGVGESRPVAANDSEAGRAENRRVEIAAL